MTPLKLLCTDLDRTLLPNGSCVESPGVRQQLAAYLQQHQVKLAFVSGRDRGLVQQAIAEYELPLPDFVIADVGTSLYLPDASWHHDERWQQQIGVDWRFAQPTDLYALVADIPGLSLQESHKQGRYKLSFYTPIDWDLTLHETEMQLRFTQQNWQVQLVFSLDEEKQVGLLDVIPASAGKLGAIHFLMRQLQIEDDAVLFAGDSGNDLDVLCSALPAVLVANATGEVQSEAQRRVQQDGIQSRLYLAQGRIGNGCYAAGILEGIQHFFGEAAERR
ncbi:MAG: HAD-IIB family hydrolase [Gammaproteobacteria bacterium]